MAIRRDKNLFLFVTLSLVLHIVFLASLLPESRIPAWRLGEPLSRDGEILVAIQAPGYSAPQRKSAPAPMRSHPTRAWSTASDGARIDELADKQEHGPTAAIVLGEVRSRLVRYLAYPPLARARGWEGTVLVGFRLGSDGQLEAIRVARSSGYDILDESALDSLGKVGRLDAVGDASTARPQQLELAVVYRLEPR